MNKEQLENIIGILKIHGDAINILFDQLRKLEAKLEQSQRNITLTKRRYKRVPQKPPYPAHIDYQFSEIFKRRPDLAERLLTDT